MRRRWLLRLSFTWLLLVVIAWLFSAFMVFSMSVRLPVWDFANFNISTGRIQIYLRDGIPGRRRRLDVSYGFQTNSPFNNPDKDFTDVLQGFFFFNNTLHGQMVTINLHLPMWLIFTVSLAVYGGLRFFLPPPKVIKIVAKTPCPQCGYDLQGLPKSSACPECGYERDTQT